MNQFYFFASTIALHRKIHSDEKIDIAIKILRIVMKFVTWNGLLLGTQTYFSPKHTVVLVVIRQI